MLTEASGAYFFLLIWNICLQKRWHLISGRKESRSVCIVTNATAFLIRLAVSTWFSLKHSLHHLVQRANRWFLWPKSSLLWIGARDLWNSWKKGFNHSDALSFGFNLVNIGGAYVCHPRITFTAGAGTLRFEVTHVCLPSRTVLSWAQHRHPTPSCICSWKGSMLIQPFSFCAGPR